MKPNKKPRIKFYSNGLLIVENNKYSILWYSFELQRIMCDSILSMKPLNVDKYTMEGLTPN